MSRPCRTLTALSSSLVLVSLAAFSLAACSGDDTSPRPDGSGGGDGSGGSGAGSGGAGSGDGGSVATGGSGAGGPSWPTGAIRPTRFRIPEPTVDEAPCSADGSGAVTESAVLLGQTHLTPIGWPLQTVSANRPLTIAVAAEGTGEAPAFTAKATLDGAEITICLAGPPNLGSDHRDWEASTYRGTLPSQWVQPGLEVTVEGGGVSETLSPAIVAENGMTLYVMDARLFGEGENEPPSDEQLTEFLARLPVSYLDVGYAPLDYAPEHLLIGARSDGNAPSGGTTSHGAIIARENPHCSAADQSAGTCTLHSGYGAMAGVLGALDVLRYANGLGGLSTWYADLGVALGGGLAGGQRGTGDDLDLTMNHELGHAWGFPHWAAGDTAYPYEGVQRDRGGFGDYPAIDQVTGEVQSILCDGLERQSPMQRAGSCVPDGGFYDFFSDYESARLLRMVTGATDELAGNVDYSGGVVASPVRAFTLPAEGGRKLLSWNEDGPGFSLLRYDEAENEYVPFEDTAWNRLEETEVEVTLFSGAVIVGGDAVVEEPIEYVGNLVRSLDPTTNDGYGEMFDERYGDFYWAHDLVLRFTLEDGEARSFVSGREAVLREAGDSASFGINLPRELADQVVKLEVLARPCGQYDAASELAESLEPSTYLDDAMVLVTWER